MRRRTILALLGVVLLIPALGLIVATRRAIRPLPDLAGVAMTGGPRARLLDRNGEPIAVTYDNPWNVHDVVPLHEFPPLLRDAFVTSEDRRFFRHHGVDWRARAHALLQNLRARRAVRGASTISEQVVRMLHPRPRSMWVRHVEGVEAAELERRHGKGEILEFYLNQVPYARQRRGVVQAARDSFDRDLDTLTARELLALAVLVRSPSRLDLRRGEAAGSYVDDAIDRLACRLSARGVLTETALRRIRSQRLGLREPGLDLRAPHFVRFVRRRSADRGPDRARIRTTLDGSLQLRVEAVLEQRIEALGGRGASDGAVLVVDHRANEILAWVNAGGFSAQREGSQIDAVLAPRQPGSTLKPFLYALALAQGWTASTLIDDAPFAARVGSGLHRFRNYSRLYHGPLRLRDALGNSLNIPAVRTIRSVTPGAFYRLLRDVGFESLDRHPDVYGEGLALGNAEVTLYELVGAYATLARGGQWAAFHEVVDDAGVLPRTRRVFTEEIASIIADILSDPGARALEFGPGGVLDLPVQTAVKTGTSNDYRDAWAVGFSDRHTVGVWIGNLDRREMDGVSGSIGPALVLRAVFAELRREGEPGPLFVSRKLRRVQICRQSGALPLPGCPLMEEWFRAERVPERTCPIHGPIASGPAALSRIPGESPDVARLVRPTPDLHLAMDPRIPDEVEAFAFEIEAPGAAERVRWFVDEEPVGTSEGPRFVWPLVRGEHSVRAVLRVAGSDSSLDTERVRFVVK